MRRPDRCIDRTTTRVREVDVGADDATVGEHFRDVGRQVGQEEFHPAETLERCLVGHLDPVEVDEAGAKLSLGEWTPEIQWSAGSRTHIERNDELDARGIGRHRPDDFTTTLDTQLHIRMRVDPASRQLVSDDP